MHVENINIKIISLTVLHLKEFASSWTGKAHITKNNTEFWKSSDSVGNNGNP